MEIDARNINLLSTSGSPFNFIDTNSILSNDDNYDAPIPFKSKMLQVMSQTNLFALIPAGTIIALTEDKDPHILYGGSWERISEGTVLVGINDPALLLTTDGEYQHTLTVAELPAHTHTLRGRNKKKYDGSRDWDYGRGTNQTSGTTATGGSLPHNNIQPYETVYYWRSLGTPTYELANNVLLNTGNLFNIAVFIDDTVLTSEEVLIEGTVQDLISDGIPLRISRIPGDSGSTFSATAVIAVSFAPSQLVTIKQALIEAKLSGEPELPPTSDTSSGGSTDLMGVTVETTGSATYPIYYNTINSLTDFPQEIDNIYINLELPSDQDWIEITKLQFSTEELSY